MWWGYFFFFQAEEGIRYLVRSRGLFWALFWLVRALLDAPVLFWARVGSPGLVWALLGSLGLVWALLGSPGFIRASLGSYGFFHGQCGHTLIMIYEGRHDLCLRWLHRPLCTVDGTPRM